MIGKSKLAWKRERGEFRLYHGRSLVMRAIPDEKYLGMWRVKSRDGRLSDMVNLTWAKDAAMDWACRELNRIARAA